MVRPPRPFRSRFSDAGSRVRLRCVLVLFGIVVAAQLVPAAASAHSSLEESQPALDEKVVEVKMVRLQFGEPLTDDEQNLVWLLDTADGRIALGAPRLVERNYVLEADVPVDLAVGTYYVYYQAVSSDGHGLQEGNYRFEVVAPAGNGGTFLLLAVGAGAMVVVVFLLRPRGRGSKAKRERGDDSAVV